MILFGAMAVGLLVGSFLNVCIHRWPKDLSVVRPRSFCPVCEHPIAWYDNVPVASYLWLRGRCRYCAAPISMRYPVVELLTGLLFAASIAAGGPSLAGLKLCVFCALLVGLVFTDLEERILPDEMTLGGTVAGLAFAAASPNEVSVFMALPLPVNLDRVWVSLFESALSAVLGAGLLWLVGTIYLKLRHKEGLGLGDVKMVGMIGAFLGLEGVLLTVMAGSVLGSVLGLLYIMLSRKDAASYELPFGTFLGAAAVLVALLGPYLRVGGLG